MRCEETLHGFLKKRHRSKLQGYSFFWCLSPWGSSKPSSSRTSLSWICKQNQRTLEHKLLMCWNVSKVVRKSIIITHVTYYHITKQKLYSVHKFCGFGLVFPALIFHLPASHRKGRCGRSCIEYLQSQENVATVDVWYIPSGRPQKQMQADQIFATTHHSSL